MHALRRATGTRAAAQPSLRWAKVQRRVQCSTRLLEVETGRIARRRSAAVPCGVRRLLRFGNRSASVSDLKLKFPARFLSFSHFFACRLHFFSLLDGPSARICCSNEPQVPTRQPSPVCFHDRAANDLKVERLWLRSQDLGNLEKTFHIEEKKPAALLGRARSKA